jgi:hypothetical protein
MVDFEPAFITAVQAEFPGVVMTTCLFHLGQSHWRKVRDLGFYETFMEQDGVFATWCKSFTALAFLRVGDVEQGFLELCRDPGMDPRLNEFMEYIEVKNSLAHRFLITFFPPSNTVLADMTLC